MQGKIKTLKAEKNFGFIAIEGESKDIFFHSTGLINAQFPELAIGDSVSFEVEESEKGPKAVKVAKL